MTQQTLHPDRLTASDRIALRIADFSMSRPWLTMLLCLVVLATLGSGVTGLGLSSNYRSYFGPQNPELLAFDEFQDTYTKNDNIFFLIKPDDNQVFTPRIMEAVENLTERAWQIPHVLRVDSVTNFQHTHADGDELTEPLTMLVQHPHRAILSPENFACHLCNVLEHRLE